MHEYKQTDSSIWTGRSSNYPDYLYQVVECCTTDTMPATDALQRYAFLGYCVDEGVRRSFGRIGAADGPDAIRKALGKLPVHFGGERKVIDAGNLYCNAQQLEAVQAGLSEHIEKILRAGYMPLLLGGGQDMAYGHYVGIRNFLPMDKTIGIINFDGHFDMSNDGGAVNTENSFFQIAKAVGGAFRYLCLGVRPDANTTNIFEVAELFDVGYAHREYFSLPNSERIRRMVEDFIARVDVVYVTIDLDGFASAYAPGVSLPSPLGFEPDIVFEMLDHILYSGKLISVDVAEMNPLYDREGQTAALAAGLLFRVLHGIRHSAEV